MQRPLSPDDLRALAKSSKLIPVTGGGIVYGVPDGWMMVLNGPAALVWLCASQGLDLRATQLELAQAFDLDAATAEDWLARAMTGFAEQSFEPRKVTVPAPRPQKHVARGKVIRLLDSTVSVVAPPELWPLLDTLLAGLHVERVDADMELTVAAGGPDSFTLTLGPDRREAALRTLVPELEHMLLRALVPLSPHRMMFHAALVVWGDAGCLLVAPSGSGKTTLSVALGSSGWKLGSDELVQFDGARGWRGVPLPPCIKSTNYAQMGERFFSLNAAPEHDRFGRRVKYLPLTCDHESQSVRTVYFPHYREGGETLVESLLPIDGLSIVLSQCLQLAADFNESDLLELAKWHEDTSYRLVYFGDAWDAARRLQREAIVDGLQPNLG